MRFYLLPLSIVGTLGVTNASAQSLSGDLLCSEVISPLLTMVENVELIPENFDMVYQSLSAVDRARFAEVKAQGEQLSDVAVAYRAAFLEACFGG